MDIPAHLIARVNEALDIYNVCLADDKKGKTFVRQH